MWSQGDDLPRAGGCMLQLLRSCGGGGKLRRRLRVRRQAFRPGLSIGRAVVAKAVGYVRHDGGSVTVGLALLLF